MITWVAVIAGCRNDYDVNGNLLKTKSYLEVKEIQNAPTIMKILMQDVQEGRSRRDPGHRNQV